MTFFNKKTDVIDIELTPYGRYLLSIGKLKPAFYEFSDENVLYDGTAGGVQEAQTESHNRITKDTPSLKTLYLKKGAQKVDHMQSLNALNVYQDIAIDNIRNQVKTLTHDQNGVYSLGRSSYKSDRLPSFQVSMLQGNISGSTNFLQEGDSVVGDVIDSLQIPQVNIDFVVTATTGSILNDTEEFNSFSSRVFENGDFVKLTFEEPVIHLKEFNSFYEQENFEIEVFRVEETKTQLQNQKVKTLIPLKFKKLSNPIQNDLLVDVVEIDEPDEGDLGPDFVEYFFEVEVDDEIPVEDICKIVDGLEINSQFLDEELICPDQRTERFDIYSTRVDPGDLEDCD